MHRFYIEEQMINNGQIYISGEEYHHLARVLRASAGDEIVVFDDTGMQYFCRINEIGSRSAVLDINDIKKKENDSGIDITLYQAVPKSDKMELVIQKSVELGVSKICPVRTKRVIADIDTAKAVKRIERWNRISKEASKQSQRTKLVQVTDILDFKDAVDEGIRSTYCIFPYEKEEKNRMIAQDIKANSSFSVFIGPEGGFDEDEVLYASQMGIVPVTLGKRILRTETAPLTVLSILLYIKGEI